MARRIRGLVDEETWVQEDWVRWGGEPEGARQWLALGGSMLDFPILYRSCRAMVAGYVLPKAKARELVPQELVPSEPTMLQIIGLDMRESTIEPYRELLVGIPVHKGGGGLLGRFSRVGEGLWIVASAVTTELVRFWGEYWYGIPRMKAEITFTEADGGLLMEARSGREDLLSLLVADPGGTEVDRGDLMLYTTWKGSLCATIFEVEIERSHKKRDGIGATLDLGTHEISEKIKGLITHKPSLVERSFWRTLGGKLYPPNHTGRM